MTRWLPGTADDQILHIRRSELKDAQQLMKLDALIWDYKISPAPVRWGSVEQYLQHCPPGSQLLAEKEGKLCGYVGFVHSTSMPCHRHVWEIHVAVHPHYQRKGIGSKLVQAVKRVAAEEGIRKLSLRVLSTNPGALLFYERCGFQIQGRLVEEYLLEGQYVDDILMWCPVNGMS